jgi:ubiquinone/menaquinone biosynthesis C-methylase UbiE
MVTGRVRGAQMSGNSADFGGSIAKDYDAGLGPVIFKDYADEMARRAAMGNAERLLETACGTGIVTRALRDMLPSAVELTATDLTRDMMAVAQAKFRPDENVRFDTADGMALPFPDGSFDAIVCQFGMMFYPDKDKGYREAYRVLASGGRYLFSVWDSHRYNAFGRITHSVVEACFPQNPPPFYRIPFGYNSIDAIKDQVAKAGFTNLTVSVLPREKTIPDLKSFTRGIVFGGPLRVQIEGQGGDPRAIQDAVTTAMEKEFGTPATLQLQAILFEATKPADG